MFEKILMILAVVGLFGYVFVNLFVPDKQKHKSYRECQPNCSNKWIYVPSSGVFLVKGDFWIGSNLKAEMPYQIVNVDCVLYEFKTEDEANKALEQIAFFLNDEEEMVFELDDLELLEEEIV